MDAAYQIRPAVGADIERVVALEREIWTAPHWAVTDYLGALTLEGGEAEAFGTRRCFFVACWGEEPVGFVVGRVTALDADVLAELESVGVADSARRKGVGRELCRAVIEWSRAEGAAEIELEVRSRSDGAIELYRGLGFTDVGSRGGYYRAPEDDAVLMRLKLSARAAQRAEADSHRE